MWRSKHWVIFSSWLIGGRLSCDSWLYLIRGCSSSNNHSGHAGSYPRHPDGSHTPNIVQCWWSLQRRGYGRSRTTGSVLKATASLFDGWPRMENGGRGIFRLVVLCVANATTERSDDICCVCAVRDQGLATRVSIAGGGGIAVLTLALVCT